MTENVSQSMPHGEVAAIGTARVMTSGVRLVGQAGHWAYWTVRTYGPRAVKAVDAVLQRVAVAVFWAYLGFLTGAASCQDVGMSSFEPGDDVPAEERSIWL